MFDPENPKRPVLMADFPAACERICSAMPHLKSLLLGNELLRKRLYAVDFLATLSANCWSR